MITVSISLDEETKQDIDQMAKESGKSRSDIIRETFAYHRLEKTMAKLRMQAEPLLKELGLETEEDIAAYVQHH
jgi:predicted transcriptional regulator